MKGPFHSTSGIAYPTDLTLLSKVFDRLCREHGFSKADLEAEDLGKAAMSLFAAGISDEDELLASLKEYLSRKSGRGRP
jgi:hypothetical protein